MGLGYIHRLSQGMTLPFGAWVLHTLPRIFFLFFLDR